MQIGIERPRLNRKLCFVIMPFRTDLDPIHQTIREAVALNNGLTCERADDISSVGVVVDEVWERICEAQVVVAEATGRNANVFYEMGLAHAIGKPVVILAQSASDIRFHLQHRRVILYEPNRLDQLRTRLASTLEGLCWKIPEIKRWVTHPTMQFGSAFLSQWTVRT